jgi:hypothetical protein
LKLPNVMVAVMAGLDWLMLPLVFYPFRFLAGFEEQPCRARP